MRCAGVSLRVSRLEPLRLRNPSAIGGGPELEKAGVTFFFFFTYVSLFCVGPQMTGHCPSRLRADLL